MYRGVIQARHGNASPPFLKGDEITLSLFQKDNSIMIAWFYKTGITILFME
jgi:hypothetical protein